MTLKTKIQTNIALFGHTYFVCGNVGKLSVYFIPFVGITTSEKREDFTGPSCFCVRVDSSLILLF